MARVMNRIIVIVFAVFCMNSAAGQSSAIERLFPCVIYIQGLKVQTITDASGSYELYVKNLKTNELRPHTVPGSGTAFLVANEIDVYLVTAQHVAEATRLNPIIVLSSIKNYPVVFNLKDIVDKKYFEGEKVNWFSHPSADVAVIPLSIPTNLPDSIIFTPLPLDMINNELKAPARHRELTVYGYPLTLGIGKRISPVSKVYRPASGLIDHMRGDGHGLSTFFLIDDLSISGLSGGPVFALMQYEAPMNFSLSNEVGLFGIVHGTISGKDGGGYGAIVPSKFILETIALAPAFTGINQFKYKSGRIWSEVYFKNGIAWEVISNFNTDGKPQEKGTLKNGSGTRNIYDEKGILREVRYYERGKLLRIEEKEK